MWKKRLLLGLTLLLPVARLLGQDKASDLAIVVGKNSALESVSSAELLKILRAEKTKGPDGVKFILTMREPGSAERAAVLSQVYQMSEADYTKYFLQATFTGAVTVAPKQIAGAAALRQFLGTTPGAIGYMRASEVDETLKTVKVDGKAPGEADYRLKIK